MIPFLEEIANKHLQSEQPCKLPLKSSETVESSTSGPASIPTPQPILVDTVSISSLQTQSKVAHQIPSSSLASFMVQRIKLFAAQQKQQTQPKDQNEILHRFRQNPKLMKQENRRKTQKRVSPSLKERRNLTLETLTLRSHEDLRCFMERKIIAFQKKNELAVEEHSDFQRIKVSKNVSKIVLKKRLLSEREEPCSDDAGKQPTMLQLDTPKRRASPTPLLEQHAVSTLSSSALSDHPERRQRSKRQRVMYS